MTVAEDRLLLSSTFSFCGHFHTPENAQGEPTLKQNYCVESQFIWCHLKLTLKKDLLL